jgi:peptidoglycan/LPS O-acetylase OafA/YrhL
VSDEVTGRHVAVTGVTVEGVVDHADGTVEVPPADRLPKAAHPGTTRTWLTGIEALRGVAALTVLAEHAWALSVDPIRPGGAELPLYRLVGGLGSWGVLLFFMLSGYLLADTFWRTEKADLRVYAIRRFFRIAPAYYVNVAILFLFLAAPGLLFSSQGVKQVLANLTFTQHLSAGTTSSFNVNGALWTLTIEMMLYLFLPLMALLVGRAPWSATILFIVLGLGWRLLIAVHGDGLRDFWYARYADQPGGLPPVALQSNFVGQQFPGALSVFALGIIARWLVVHGSLDRIYNRLPARLGVSSFLVLALPSLALLYWFADKTDYTHVVWFTLCYFLLMLALLPALLLAARPQQFSPSPLRAVGSWLGERSYSIYLWHFPIILAVYERGPLTLPPPVGGYAWRLPVVLLITLVVAAASYRLIERPGMELGRRLSERLTRRRTPILVKEPAS